MVKHSEARSSAFNFLTVWEGSCFLVLVVILLTLPTQYGVNIVQNSSFFGLFLKPSVERRRNAISSLFAFLQRKKLAGKRQEAFLDSIRQALGDRQDLRNIVWSVSLCFPFVLSEIPCVFLFRFGWLKHILSSITHILYLLIPSLVTAVISCGSISKRTLYDKLTAMHSSSPLICKLYPLFSWTGADWLPVFLLYLPVELKLLPKYHKPIKLPWTGVMGAICLVLTSDILAASPLRSSSGRPLYSWQLTSSDLQWCLAGFIFISVFCNMIGWELEFIAWNPPNWKNFSIENIIRWLGLAFVTFVAALPEEILFRGVIQHKLEHYFAEHSCYWSLTIASFVFGLIHLKNPLQNFGVPNWRFAILATIAGISYGWVFEQTHSVLASSLTHGLTNLIWRTFFWKNEKST